MRSFAALPLAALLAGCPALGARAIDRVSDRDGDGVPSEAYGGRDCDDLDPAVNPDATEICDGLDNDCDGLLNEDDPDAVGVDWYRDADQDGAGDEASHLRTCAALGSLGEAWVRAGAAFDCDDTDPEQHPLQQWRVDGDGDGFPSGVGTPRLQCARPEDFVPVTWLPQDDPDAEPVEDESVWDCRDFDATVFPDAVEVCNEVDDDCDDAIDGEDDSLQALIVYQDGDGDLFGGGEPIATCAPTEDEVPVGGDCDDADPGIGPLIPEIPYDGIDQDCAGRGDLEDVDGDGEPGVLAGGTDCDDRAAWVHPGAAELCDGADNDCDGEWDPADEAGAAWIESADGIDPSSTTVRRYTDLSTLLLPGGGAYQVPQFVAPGEGTLWLCDDAVRTGSISSVSRLEIRPPDGQAPVFGAPGNQAFLNVLDVTMRDLEFEGNVFGGGSLTLERVTLTGSVNTWQGSATLRDTVLRNPYGGLSALTLTGPGVLDEVVVTGGGLVVSGDNQTLTITGGAFRDVPYTFALQLQTLEAAVLEDVRFDSPSGSISAWLTDSLEGTALRFVGGGTDVRFGTTRYDAPDGEVDVSCQAGAGCTFP